MNQVDTSIKELVKLKKEAEKAKREQNRKLAQKLKKKANRMESDLLNFFHSDLRNRVLTELNRAGITEIVCLCIGCGYATTEPIKVCKKCGGIMEIYERKEFFANKNQGGEGI